MIKIEKLNKFFNKGKQNEIHVINDVSLELPDKGMVAIFGRSGCGKTTLLNVIGGLDGFDSGKLTVEDCDMKRNADVTRNKYIGYIFQNYNLNKIETCFDNVADALRLCGFPEGEQMKRRVLAALKNVGMENYHGRTPDTLSGGQQQRIAIARAIVKNPKIILADEPTGNLDEANTVMIMDLLKEISRDHLVLLVTHEANLVDYYCDTVVELSDGKIADIRHNAYAEGFTARGKNDIYLGELEQTKLGDEHVALDFYGDAPSEPLSLTVVNSGGKLYVQIKTSKVQVLDASSEVKLREGSYADIAEAEKKTHQIDMSELPPVEGKRFGHLFGMKNSIKSGYAASFKRGKRGKKLLRGCMCLFAVVVVLMSAVFGTAFADLRTAKYSYNHNVFYVYSGTGDISDRLNSAVGDESSAIDSVNLMFDIPYGDETVKFVSGYFESFSSSTYDKSYRTNAVPLPVSLAEGCTVLVGKATELASNEAVITSRVADALLESSTLGYISEYRDLLGLITTTIRIDGQNLHIAGVVKSDESAIYLSDFAMASYAMSGATVNASLASDIGLDVPDGKTVFVTRYDEKTSGIKIPKEGDSIKMHGKSFEVARVIKFADTYDSWLADKGIVMEQQEGESIAEYCARAYSRLDEYLTERYIFDKSNNMDMWLYVEKGVDEIKYMYAMNDMYYASEMYKSEHGVYPDDDQLYECIGDYNEKLNQAFETAHKFYDNEYNNLNGLRNVDNSYFVSENDYIALSKRYGESDKSALVGGSYKSDYYYEDVYYETSVVIGGSASSSYADDSDNTGAVYAVIHSSDPRVTEEYLKREFSDIETGKSYMPAMLTPDELFERNISENYTEILTSITAMAVILAVMSVCMYFIMRSSLMNRIKEVGIYRAIGVSKKNLIFKFFIEALLLTSLTVLIGYLLMSTFLGVALGMSPTMKTFLYYPLWLAAAVLALLYVLCLFFGTLPILSLLRKKPSEILSKYDI